MSCPRTPLPISPMKKTAVTRVPTYTWRSPRHSVVQILQSKFRAGVGNPPKERNFAGCLACCQGRPGPAAAAGSASPKRDYNLLARDLRDRSPGLRFDFFGIWNFLGLLAWQALLQYINRSMYPGREARGHRFRSVLWEAGLTHSIEPDINVKFALKPYCHTSRTPKATPMLPSVPSPLSTYTH